MVLDYMTYLLSLIYCLYYSIILLSLFWKLHLPWFLTLSLICEANNSALLMMRGIISRTRIASWSPFKKLFLLSMIEEQYSLCFQQVIDLSHKCRTWFFVYAYLPPLFMKLSPMNDCSSPTCRLACCTSNFLNSMSIVYEEK